MTTTPTQAGSHRSTRSNDRTGREQDPVAAYIYRSKRGTTETEVRLITGDYSELQLGQSPYELENNMPAAMELRRRQQQWYLDALAEGLDLTPEQKAQARERMRGIFEADVRALETANSDLQQGRASSDELVKKAKSRFRFLDDWFYDSAFAPWNLSDLSDAQMRLTFKSKIEEEWESRKKSDPDMSEENAPQSWLHFVGSAQNPISGELVRPHPGANPKGSGFDMVRVLPLTPDQLAAQAEDDLTQAKRLQPAQLRIALLLAPGDANRLASQLGLPHSSYSGYPPDY